MAVLSRASEASDQDNFFFCLNVDGLTDTVESEGCWERGRGNVFASLQRIMMSSIEEDHLNC